MDWSRGRFHLGVGGRSPINHFWRFCTSPHTRDLFVICCGSVLLIVLFAYSLLDPDSVPGLFAVKKDGAGIRLPGLPLEWGAVLITGLLGFIGWSYQAANSRFGAADLFAAEIGALCRIAAVAELVANYAKVYRAGETPPAPVNSTNDYFAVFNNNAKDMEVLDGDVVGAVTQFYANIKVFQDCLRRSSAADARLRREQQLATMYYGFLAFESARLALAVLIDDRDRCEEGILTAMMSELPGYFFLYRELCDCTEDVRWHRISARFDGYERLIREIANNPPRTQCVADLARPVVTMWREFEAQGSRPQTRIAAEAAE